MLTLISVKRRGRGVCVLFSLVVGRREVVFLMGVLDRNGWINLLAYEVRF